MFCEGKNGRSAVHHCIGLFFCGLCRLWGPQTLNWAFNNAFRFCRQSSFGELKGPLTRWLRMFGVIALEILQKNNLDFSHDVSLFALFFLQFREEDEEREEEDNCINCRPWLPCDFFFSSSFSFSSPRARGTIALSVLRCTTAEIPLTLRRQNLHYF